MARIVRALDSSRLDRYGNDTLSWSFGSLRKMRSGALLPRACLIDTLETLLPGAYPDFTPATTAIWSLPLISFSRSHEIGIAEATRWPHSRLQADAGKAAKLPAPATHAAAQLSREPRLSQFSALGGEVLSLRAGPTMALRRHTATPELRFHNRRHQLADHNPAVQWPAA